MWVNLVFWCDGWSLSQNPYRKYQTYITKDLFAVVDSKLPGLSEDFTSDAEKCKDMRNGCNMFQSAQRH